MESSPDGDDKNNDTGWSHALTVKTVSKRQQLATTTAGTLTLPPPPPLPTLPFELIIEILWRLPVKLLMKLKCLCKSWNSLISSDRKFAMKHLRMSRMNPKLIINFKTHSFDSTRIVYPIRSFFTNGNGIIDSIDCDKSINIVGSCDGILCLFQQKNSSGKNFIPPSLSLWNPSTGKYNPLPYLDEPRLNNDDWFVDDYEPTETVYSFGYDHLIDKYKVVAVSMYGKRSEDARYPSEEAYKTQVKVHTSGTNSWRLIQNFPSEICITRHLQSGIFVSGRINWLVRIGDQPIVSLDLGTESYQQILYPDQVAASTLGVLRDCLCILCCRDDEFTDIWLMKEYGNIESWIKLASVPYMGWINNVLYVSEDDQLLLDISDYMLKSELVVYDPKNGNSKIQDIKNFYDLGPQDIYVESLISPCP